jgi:polyferredoxin
MPRRRRVYVIRLEDLLNDPPPPSRLKPLLRAGAYAALIVITGALLIQLLNVLIPDRSALTVVLTLNGYALILLLFFACAKRINHVE